MGSLLIACLMALAVLAVVDHVRTSDYDLYGHVLFGRSILERGSVPRADTYSYSAPGSAWVDHEWLTEVVFARLYGSAGAGGLILWRLAMGLAVAGLLFDLIRRSVRSPIPRWGLFWAALASMAPFLQFRPQMATYLGFTFCLWVLFGRGRSERRWLLFLPLMMVPWTNAHGGFMAGLGLVGLVAAGRAFTAVRAIGIGKKSLRREALLLAATFFGMTLATLANPYGLALHRSVLAQTTSTVTAGLVLEWLPLWRQVALGENIAVVVPFAALAVAAGLIARGRPRRMEAARWVVLAVMGLLAVKALRHVPLAAPAMVAAVLPAVPEAWRREEPLSLRASAGLMVAAIALTASFFRPASLRPQILLAPGSFPVEAVSFMRANGVRGNVLAQFRWGEYVLWRLGGEARVFMDQRYDSVYPERTIEEYLDVALARPGAREALSAYPHDFALLLPQEKTEALLRDAGARKLFADESAVLYAFPTERGEELLGKLDSGSLLHPPPAPARPLFP